MPGPRRTDLVTEALAAQRGSKRIALPGPLSFSAPGAWCELVRDVGALANSGGGAIVIDDPNDRLRLSAGDVERELATYTGERFTDLRVSRARKGIRRAVVIEVGPRTGSPLVFEKASTAFAEGTVYFRHGARSAPATAADVARFAKRELTGLRRELIAHLRDLVTAPTGSEVIVVPPAAGPTGTVGRFRVVDDPTAPALSRTDFDVTHPFRQTEVVQAVNDRAGAAITNAYELQCVRRAFHIDGRAEFFHRPKFGSPQYSDAFVAWLVGEYEQDPQFFEKAKIAGAPGSQRVSGSG